MRRKENREPPLIPDHTVLSWIGGGSYGDVWLCRTVVGTLRAVKVIHRDNFSSKEPFARAFAGLERYEPISRSYPGLVQVLQIGRNEEEGYFYYVMELANAREGNEPGEYRPETLESVVARRGRMTVREALELAASLARAVGHLHQHELIHRDIKPSNIIFVKGEAKLADIDLVAAAESARTFVGTEGFIAPEGPYSKAADIYSLGKVLYEAATGKDRLAYPEPRTGLPPEETRGLREFFEILFRACERRPEKRYGSMAEMLRDIALMQAGESVRSLRENKARVATLKRLASVAVLIALLGGGGYLYQRRQSEFLQRALEQGRGHLVRFHVANGVRHMDEGDLLGSLPWFVEALQLDEGDKYREELHRARFGAVLQQAPKLVAMGAHGGTIEHAELGASGELVATAATDNAALIWRAATGARLATLRHENDVARIHFSHGGDLVTTASLDGTAVVWHARTGKKQATFRHAKAVREAIFSPDDRFVLTGSDDGVVRVWDLATERLAGATERHDGGVSCLAVSRDGELLLTGGQDGTARVWSAKTGAAISPPLRHEAQVRAVAFNPLGSLVATGGSDRTARLWETRTGRPASEALKHTGSVVHLEFSRDGKTLLSAGARHRQSGEVRVWRLKGTAPLAAASGDPMLMMASVGSVDLSPSGVWIAAGSSDGVTRIYDTATGQRQLWPFFNQHSVRSVAFSPDETRLLIAAADGTWRVWSLPSEEHAQTRIRHGDYVASIEFSPDGKRIVTAGNDGFARLKPFTEPEAETDRIFFPARRARFSPEGKWLLIEAIDRMELYALRSRASETPIRTFPSGADGVFNPNSKQVAIISPTGDSILLHEIAGERTNSLRLELGSFEFPTIVNGFPGPGVAFTKNGRWVAAGWGDNRIDQPGYARIWDAGTGRPASPLIKHPGTVSSIAISPDDRFLLTACSNPSGESLPARLWNIPDGTFTGREFRGREGILSVAFSPDGKRLATAGKDGSAQVWETESGNAVGKRLAHKRGVQQVRFSPDGRKVATASYDFTVRVWETETGDPITPPFKHNGGVYGVLFSPDGKQVASANFDMTARVWEVPATEMPIETLRELGAVLSGRRVTASGSLLDAEGSGWGLRLANAHRSSGASKSLNLESKWHKTQALNAERLRDWESLVHHLDELKRIDGDSAEVSFRAERARAEFYRADPQAAPAEFANEAPKLYPPRDPATSRKMIDLSSAYNCPLLGNWNHDLPKAKALPLRRGVSSFNGTDFDVRGIIQLRFPHGVPVNGFILPSRSSAIAVGQEAARVHLLHGIDGTEPRTMARMRVHHVGGKTSELRLESEANGRYWALAADEKRLAENTSVAWRGEFPIEGGKAHPAVLYKTEWINPEPELEIERIEIEAIAGYPFLLGMTLEDK